jgi:cephalosporin hydroxylase
MTLNDIYELKHIAMGQKAEEGPEWPPSVYYRFCAGVVERMQARYFVELGTCGGGCARTVAIRNPNTKIITIDVEPLPQAYLAAKQNRNIQVIQGDSALMAHQIGPQLMNGGPPAIEVLFIDTVHEYDHVMNEFNSWRPYLKSGAVVIFDDLNREGMDRVWKDLPGNKTPFHALKELHIAGSPNDGGFGALILG